jgi:hypothetical protein
MERKKPDKKFFIQIAGMAAMFRLQMAGLFARMGGDWRHGTNTGRFRSVGKRNPPGAKLMRSQIGPSMAPRKKMSYAKAIETHRAEGTALERKYLESDWHKKVVERRERRKHEAEQRQASKLGG